MGTLRPPSVAFVFIALSGVLQLFPLSSGSLTHPNITHPSSLQKVKVPVESISHKMNITDYYTMQYTVEHRPGVLSLDNHPELIKVICDGEKELDLKFSDEIHAQGFLELLSHTASELTGGVGVKLVGHQHLGCVNVTSDRPISITRVALSYSRLDEVVSVRTRLALITDVLAKVEAEVRVTPLMDASVSSTGSMWGTVRSAVEAVAAGEENVANGYADPVDGVRAAPRKGPAHSPSQPGGCGQRDLANGKCTSSMLCSHNMSTWAMDFSGATLWESDSGSVKCGDCSVNFEPQVAIKLSIDQNYISNISIIFLGELETALSVSSEANGGFDVGKQIQTLHHSYPMGMDCHIGVWPVQTTFETLVQSTTYFGTSDGGSASLSFDASGQIMAGLGLEAGEPANVGKFSFSPSSSTPSVSVDAEYHLVTYLSPAIQVNLDGVGFYGVAFETSVELEAQYCNPDCEVTVLGSEKVVTDGAVGVTLNGISLLAEQDLPDSTIYQKQWTLYSGATAGKGAEVEAGPKPHHYPPFSVQDALKAHMDHLPIEFMESHRPPARSIELGLSGQNHTGSVLEHQPHLINLDFLPGVQRVICRPGYYAVHFASVEAAEFLLAEMTELGNATLVAHPVWGCHRATRSESHRPATFLRTTSAPYGRVVSYSTSLNAGGHRAPRAVVELLNSRKGVLIDALKNAKSDRPAVMPLALGSQRASAKDHCSWWNILEGDCNINKFCSTALQSWEVTDKKTRRVGVFRIECTKCQFKLTPQLVYNIVIQDDKMEVSSVSINGDYTAEASVDIYVTNSSETKYSKELIQISPSPLVFMLGVVPMELAPTVEVFLVADLSFYGRLDIFAGAQAKGSIGGGFHWSSSGGFDPTKHTSFDIGYRTPEMSAVVEVGAAVGIEGAIVLDVEHLCLVNVTATAGLQLSATVGDGPGGLYAKAELDWFLQSKAGGGLGLNYDGDYIGPQKQFGPYQLYHNSGEIWTGRFPHKPAPPEEGRLLHSGGSYAILNSSLS